MKTVIAAACLLWLQATVVATAVAADQAGEKVAPTKSSDAAATADSRAADEEAIRASGKAFIEAYNARDAKKLATLWSPEAIYIDPLTGEQTVGRDEIEKVFADAFADKQDAKL